MHLSRSPDAFIRTDDKRVFCAENQAVVLWGYDEDEGRRTDPPVYQGVNNDQIEWYVEASCSAFLIGMIYWQALNGGLPEVAFRSPVDERVREKASAWPLVWEDDSSQVFSRGPAVFAITRDEEEIEVQAAGVSAVELDNIWSLLGLTRGHPE